MSLNQYYMILDVTLKPSISYAMMMNDVEVLKAVFNKAVHRLQYEYGVEDIKEATRIVKEYITINFPELKQ